MTEVSDLATKKCKPCEGGVAPLKQDEVSRLLKQLRGWKEAGGKITKSYAFKDHHQVMAFVNAVNHVYRVPKGWLARREHARMYGKSWQERGERAGVVFSKNQKEDGCAAAAS